MSDPSRFYRLAEYVFNRHFFEHGNAAADRNDIIQAAMLRLTLDMRRVPGCRLGEPGTSMSASGHARRVQAH